MQNSFPLFSSHLSVLCFHCETHIGDKGTPINYGFPRGKYGSWCNDCKLRTYYDTMHKFPKFALVLQSMQALPNVMVRPSSDSINGEFITGTHGSVIVADADVLPSGVALCKAYENAGKCSGCRACYDKAVPVIAYPAHGKKMLKVIRINKG